MQAAIINAKLNVIVFFLMHQRISLLVLIRPKKVDKLFPGFLKFKLSQIKTTS